MAGECSVVETVVEIERWGRILRSERSTHRLIGSFRLTACVVPDVLQSNQMSHFVGEKTSKLVDVTRSLAAAGPPRTSRAVVDADVDVCIVDLIVGAVRIGVDARPPNLSRCPDSIVVIEIQGKASELLGRLLAESDDDPRQPR